MPTYKYHRRIGTNRQNVGELNFLKKNPSHVGELNIVDLIIYLGMPIF